ncbi:hypothetical protein QQP08_012079 [Theobroma cacao]|nr:hypothetical protein QQP08_012079 [Theobroma cacao]
MEAAKLPVCLSMKRYRRRKKYQRLKRVISAAHEDKESEATSMLEEYRRRGWKSKVMVPKNIASPVEPLRKWRDSYEEMMLCFAGHFTQLSNGNVYLFKRIPKANSHRLGNLDG